MSTMAQESSPRGTFTPNFKLGKCLVTALPRSTATCAR
jgi:hypothetical protein